jgi:hypothetical protein
MKLLFASAIIWDKRIFLLSKEPYLVKTLVEESATTRLTPVRIIGFRTLAEPK